MDIFSKIAAGEIPSYKCAENEEFYPRHQSAGKGSHPGDSPS